MQFSDEQKYSHIDLAFEFDALLTSSGVVALCLRLMNPKI